MALQVDQYHVRTYKAVHGGIIAVTFQPHAF